MGTRCEGLGTNPFTGLPATNTSPAVGRGSLGTRVVFALYGVPIRMKEMSDVYWGEPEPHIDKFAVEFFYIYIYIISYVVP